MYCLVAMKSIHTHSIRLAESRDQWTSSVKTILGAAGSTYVPSEANWSVMALRVFLFVGEVGWAKSAKKNLACVKVLFSSVTSTSISGSSKSCDDVRLLIPTLKMTLRTSG